MRYVQPSFIGPYQKASSQPFPVWPVSFQRAFWFHLLAVTSLAVAKNLLHPSSHTCHWVPVGFRPWSRGVGHRCRPLWVGYILPNCPFWGYSIHTPTSGGGEDLPLYSVARGVCYQMFGSLPVWSWGKQCLSVALFAFLLWTRSNNCPYIQVLFTFLLLWTEHLYPWSIFLFGYWPLSYWFQSTI